MALSKCIEYINIFSLAIYHRFIYMHIHALQNCHEKYSPGGKKTPPFLSYATMIDDNVNTNDTLCLCI